MHTITVENFRCFHKKQKARLAPLTLLVGENSTGKTSFLALLRAMDDLNHFSIPNFKQHPYDLGSFNEIVSHQGGGVEKKFSAEVSSLTVNPNSQDHWKIKVEFEKDREGTAPVPVYQYVALNAINGKDNGHWIEIDFRSSSVKLGINQETWEFSKGAMLQPGLSSLVEILTELQTLQAPKISSNSKFIKIKEDSSNFTTKDVLDSWMPFMSEIFTRQKFHSVHASAPVRSNPRRTYDPERPAFDPEGSSTPMILADISSHSPKLWGSLRKYLEKFGRQSGLFDQIRIRNLGSSSSDPFQVQVKVEKFRQKDKEVVWRNLRDVGYGVGQVLPVVMQLFLVKTFDRQRSENSPQRQLLLQQPEVHLHPSAQAALGSLLCQIASPNSQLIVETHSDNLIDRVRMDVRDSVSDLKPEDVSILFFERRELDVQIHSLRIDKEGNVLDAPESYRQFFMEEINRSLWPPEPNKEV